jgi:hypothetical protein
MVGSGCWMIQPDTERRELIGGSLVSISSQLFASAHSPLHPLASSQTGPAGLLCGGGRLRCQHRCLLICCSVRRGDGCGSVLIGCNSEGLSFRRCREIGHCGVGESDGVRRIRNECPCISGAARASARPLTRYVAPSYKFIGYTQVKRGYKLNPELLGDDRPDLVEAFYARERAWLETGN